MIEKSNELWLPTNKTVMSSIFSVADGYSLIIHATGLLDERVRASTDEIKEPQRMCVKRIVHGFSGVTRKNLQCSYIYDIDESNATVITDSFVQTCGDSWSLEPCKNLVIIGVPGTYRLELNDITAVGVAQAYTTIMSNSNLPYNNLQHLFLN